MTRKNENEEMLASEVDTTVIREYRTETDASGGGGVWGGSISFGSGSDSSSGESSTSVGAGGGTSSSSGNGGQEIYTQPVDTPEQLALAYRLARGEGTPAEALAYFRTHGYPQLNTLPSFEGGKWVFPQANIDASSGDGHQVGDVIFATSGQSDSLSSADPSSEPISASWAGVSNGLALPQDGGGQSNRTGQPRTRTGDVPSHQDASADPGSVIGYSDTSGSPTRTGTGDALSHQDASTVGPGFEIGDSSGSPKWADSAKAEKGPSWVDESAPGPGQFVPDPVEPEEDPYSREDDDEIAPYQSHAVNDAVDEMFGYIVNDQNPFLVRLILTQYAGLASTLVFLERYFANPLLAAPAQLVNAGKALRRATVKARAGDWLGAAQEEQVASDNLRDAAVAIAAAIPVGGALATEASLTQRLAGRGVSIARWEYVNWREFEWARHQVWVTGSAWEIRFQLEGEGAAGQLGVDGFHSSTGESILANPAAHYTVETKMAGRIKYIIWGREAERGSEAYKAWYRAIQQLDRYLELSRRLGLSGVKYVVTEEAVIVNGVATRPVTTKWREILLELYPNEFLEGFLEVLFKDPPPPEWVPPE